MGIYRSVIDPHLVVEVGTGAASALADVSDGVAAMYMLTRHNGKVCQVAVAGRDSVTVVNRDCPPVSPEKIGEDEYRMKMKMVLASLSGAFEGKVKIADQAPPALKELARTTEPGAADSVEFPDSMADRADPVRASFRLLVEGTGKIGFVKGDGLLTLTTSAAGTDVAYEGDVQVGGTMAAAGFLDWPFGDGFMPAPPAQTLRRLFGAD